MGTMSPEKLLQLWTLEEISVEMAVGHIPQNLVNLQRAHQARVATIYSLQTEIDRLIIHTGIDPHSKGKNTRPPNG